MSLMRRSNHFVAMAAGLAIGSAMLVAAVSGCMQDLTTNYGSPTGLKGRDVPDASQPGTALVPDAGTVNTTTICGGLGPINPDGGGCTVSWSKDIVPKMASGQSLACSDGNCHGQGSATLPSIPSDPTAAWNSLANYTDPGSPKVYVDICSKNADDSAFKCNLSGACLASKMPLAPGAATDDDVAKINSWLACGAPNN